MRSIAIMTVTALLLAGCGGSGPTSDDPSANTSATAQSDSFAGGPFTNRGEKPGAEPANVAPHEVEVKNDLYEFEYRYPGEAKAIPALKALLDQRLASAQAEIDQNAKAEKAEAAENDFPYREMVSTTKWSVVTKLPRWLSLSSEAYSYTGGAHGNTGYDSLLWDREQNVFRNAADLFTSKAALSRAIIEPFCAKLDKERAKRREAPVNRNSGDAFDTCIDPVENTILLGSSNTSTFDRIGILVGPHAAGPYVEGTYDITVPVTAKVVAAVKPQFRQDFSVK